MEDVYIKLDELFNLLNQYTSIMEIKEIKNQITKEEIAIINDYRLKPTVSNKKKIYEKDLLKKYLLCESDIHYLIMEINQVFKRGNGCESHKW